MNAVQNRERLVWLDVAKGIAIVLMVLGHSSIPDFFSRFIYAFHMPLFFVASGLTSRFTEDSWGRFFGKKCKTLLLPFLLYSVVVLATWKLTMGYDLKEWLLHGWQGYALWFIPVLFLSLLLGRCVSAIKNTYLRWALMLGLLVLGSLLSYVDLKLPWSLSTVPYACFFVLVGHELKRFVAWLQAPHWVILGICVLTVLAISHWWKLDMAWNCILPVLPLTIGALSGTLMIFLLSAVVTHHSNSLTRLCVAVGKETFAILSFSQIIIMLLNHYTTLAAPIRYMILWVALYAIVRIKNGVTRLMDR